MTFEAPQLEVVDLRLESGKCPLDLYCPCYQKKKKQAYKILGSIMTQINLNNSDSIYSKSFHLTN